MLGPLLFLLFINDIRADVKSPIRLFADDCLIYREITCDRDHLLLQQDLNALTNWAAEWQMTFNVDKCYSMRFSNNTRRTQAHNSYRMMGKTLEHVTSNPYLGVTFQQNLNWTLHTNNIVARARRTLTGT